MSNRFQKLRELGAKGKNYNPLILEEFQWDNEWVDEHCVQDQTTNAHDLGSILVDQDTALTQNLRGHRVASIATRATSLSLRQNKCQEEEAF
jgi:hypothetical protein